MFFNPCTHKIFKIILQLFEIFLTNTAGLVLLKVLCLLHGFQQETGHHRPVEVILNRSVATVANQVVNPPKHLLLRSLLFNPLPLGLFDPLPHLLVLLLFSEEPLPLPLLPKLFVLLLQLLLLLFSEILHVNLKILFVLFRGFVAVSGLFLLFLRGVRVYFVRGGFRLAVGGRGKRRSGGVCRNLVRGGVSVGVFWFRNRRLWFQGALKHRKDRASCNSWDKIMIKIENNF